MSGFLEFDRVTRSFGSLRAVDDVSLSIREGEVFSLLGPSGCGKTTLLRLAAGFDQPDSGRILLDGRDITALPPEKRPVNTVFQNYALFPHLTVWENVVFGLRIAGRPAGEIKTEGERMIALVRLGGHEGKKPAQLSGGQKQRAAIARALINRPEVLLLDEPLAALDLKLRQHMLVELGKIHREAGCAFVFVTHDQGEAMSLSDRIAVMNHGRIEQIGSPQDVYSRPASAFVASFIGDTNLIPGTVRAVLPGGGLEIEADDLHLSLPAEPQPIAAGSSVMLCIRPEKITLSASPVGEEGGLVQCQGTVEDVVFGGAESRCSILAGSRKLWCRLKHDRGRDSSQLQRGQPVWAHFATSDVFVLQEPQR